MAINQKPISVRMDKELLAKLDSFVAKINGKRNACINGAVEEWLKSRGA